MLGILNRRVRNALALAGLTLWATAGGAHADLILGIGQSGPGTPIHATNPTPTTTLIRGVDVGVNVWIIDPSSGLSTPFPAFLNLQASSTGAATPEGSDIRQGFAGSFAVTSGLGGAGINYLSGAFHGTALGHSWGSLELMANDLFPGESVLLTSDVIPVNHLVWPMALLADWINVTPPLAIVDNTLRAFDGGGVGLFVFPTVPEPATVATALSGLVMLGGTTLLRRRSAR